MPSSSSSVSSWSDGDNKKKKPKSGHDSDDKEFDSDGNELYVVEDIRDKRKHWDPTKKQFIWLYHLKWKGYSEKDMTWEPVSNMDCPDLLNEFELKWKAKEKAKEERKREKNRDRDREGSKIKSHDKHRDKYKERRKSFDSDYESQKPSSSKVDVKLMSAKKRRHSSDDDSSDERRKKKLKPKREKISKKGSDSDSDDNRKTKKKPKSDSDSDSDSEKKKKRPENEVEKKILSKPGPKRAKEARLAKLKEEEEKKTKKVVDSDEEKKKKKKSYESDESDEDKKDDNKSKDKDSEDEGKKKVMSKPGPKRAKEARLAKLKEEEEKAKEKAKPIESDDDSFLITDSNKKKSKDSDSDSEKATKVDKPSEEQKVMSRPGPKRAKEARLAKLSSTPKTSTVGKRPQSDDEDSNQKEKSKSDSSDESEEKKDKEPEKEEKNNETEKEPIRCKPGPKRAKEAQLAKLNQSKSEVNDNNNDNKKSDKKSSDDEIEITKETEKSEEKSGNAEEQRKSVLSRPGPKRAKEARLQKMSINSETKEKEKTNKGLENKRTNSTDSLDAIISTPAPEEDSLQMQELEAEITSPKQPLSNGVDSNGPSPEGIPDESNDLSTLDRIGNYVSIQTTKHVSEITNALSLTNGGLDMQRPGYVEKHFDIKSFPTNSKTIEKIVSAFYSVEKKLCFLIKWSGISKCDVVLADDVNKNCPQLVIDYYQSKLQFS